MPADWLDDVLKPRALPDDGFAERVIAVAQAQRRTQVLLRAVVIVLVLGALAAYCGGVVLTAAERWDNGDAILKKHDHWLDAQRADFRAVMAALDDRPALMRRTGRDAAPILDVVERELSDDNSSRSQACTDELRNDREINALASACDTSFINGLTAYDEWRRVADASTAETLAIGASRLPAVVRTHLRRAAYDGGNAFRVAAEDSVALGRLLLGHSYMGASVLRMVADETARAGANAGGFVPPLTETEAFEALHVWVVASDYGSATGTDDDVAFLLIHDRSVLSCGLRTDVEGGVLAAQELFVGRALRERNRAWTTEGCAARADGIEPWRLFGAERTTATALAAFVSRMPGMRSLMALVVTQPRWHIAILPKER